MDLLIVLAALIFLMVVAYRGYSVILFAPVAALGAVLLTDPALVAPMFTGLFMDKMVGFLKLYFPVFLLGAVFGKLIEISGFSKSIVAATIRVVGAQRAMLSIVLVCAMLTYGGVSLFVVVFAVYPFAAELFRQSDIPKRLIPGTIALGAFTFTMDALPGTPQIQNIIPTSFFGTNTWAAPWLGVIGAIFILICGMSYLEWRRRAAVAAGEGYGDPLNLLNEPVAVHRRTTGHPLVAILPLVLVGVSNKLFTQWIPQLYGKTHEFVPAVIGNAAPVVQEVPKVAAIWAVQGALLVGIACVLAFAWDR
jgi:H+/gluconate symporter-like permease